MSSTSLRIVSGAVMVVLVGLCLYIGVIPSLVAIFIMGALTIDEIVVNFYQQSRLGFRYIFAQFSFVGLYVLLNFIQISKYSYHLFISAGLVLNFASFIYLFFVKQKNTFLNNSFQKLSSLTGLFILIPVMCLSSLMIQGNWIILFVGLLILNFMVDTAAFFSGKYFGKTKLWESVSPKKTVEGLIGGVLFSVILTSIYWNFLVIKVQFQLVFIFIFMAVCSQVGDLLQSKLKREFAIKDSSSLIPGHGGVYDRIDSLLFVSPLYAALVSYIYH